MVVGWGKPRFHSRKIHSLGNGAIRFKRKPRELSIAILDFPVSQNCSLKRDVGRIGGPVKRPAASDKVKKAFLHVD